MSNWFSKLFKKDEPIEEQRNPGLSREDRAQLQGMIGELEKSLEGDLRFAEEILQADPKNESGWRMKITCLESMKRPAEAEEARRQARKLGVTLTPQ
jgi:hypothetical protein